MKNKSSILRKGTVFDVFKGGSVRPLRSHPTKAITDDDSGIKVRQKLRHFEANFYPKIFVFTLTKNQNRGLMDF